MRWSNLLFCLCWLALPAIHGCKKDVLRWAEARRIEGMPAVRWNRIATAGNGFVVVAGGEKFGRADLLISRDGGTTWEHRGFPQIGKGLYGLGVSDDGRVFACGFSEIALLSEADAQNFGTVSLPENRFYVGCAFLPAGRVAISTVTFETGTVVLRDDVAASVLDDSFHFGLNDVAFASAERGFTAGYGAIQRTDDRGKSWRITPAAGDHFVALDVHGLDTVYACGNTGSILRTTNGGENWEKLRTTDRFSQPFYALQDILFTDAQHGYCVGEDGLLIFTDDAGEHWSEFEGFTTAHLRSVAQLPGGDLLVCGDDGALWRLTPR